VGGDDGSSRCRSSQLVRYVAWHVVNSVTVSVLSSSFLHMLESFDPYNVLLNFEC
jgi:hypothetical protein